MFENVVGSFTNGVATISLKRNLYSIYHLNVTPTINNCKAAIISAIGTSENTITVTLDDSSVTGNVRMCVMYLEANISDTSSI